MHKQREKQTQDRVCFVGTSVFCCPNNMEISVLGMKWEIIIQLFELTMAMQCHDLFIEKKSDFGT